ncbi:MAG: D-alanyl-D-alanine carboxypeptidase family protein [Bacteroidales bacterium]|jgi:D-alanyl-D-alanine carboxypeptidase (penicillin-binding protein 5/6)|nr:D-alanyl-D-alanine carboxypeptidase [Bacteroidales bacterium]MDD2263640.1 D-alanyl-D-alanine carboxypeptidase [Bacteroidales bacterium]MDD2830569.1 D-alanyl-D-alanine carboxypeptidase [Bacteroidales bacterium]MDD3208838.1 D-alanyl-D-alanine carboxypeptidase [Bacteroidales bacterium]MDD3697437.1 D-alanyl-D-alanine carboxypeptidase [Bacteroidales bacterium]
MKTTHLTALWLLLLVFVACEKNVVPEPGPEPNPPVYLGLSCQGAIVIDAANGETFYSVSPDFMLVPASMTKVMTMYIVFDHIEKGYLSLESQIPVSPYAAARSINPGESNVPLNEALTYTVDEMIRALCVVSANACAVALGEYISGGTEKDFARIMNHYADSLGLTAHYDDASGLSSKNGISPRSMAELTRDFIKRFPNILEYTSLTRLNFRGTVYGTTNGMLPGQAYYYNGCDGFKTGYTNAAGLCITATAHLADKRVIAVVMKAPNSYLRYQDAAKLMDRGLSVLMNRTTVQGIQSSFL